MIRLLMLPLTLLVLSAMLYRPATPTLACQCAPLNDPVELRQLLEDYDPLVVEGAIAPGGGVDLMRFLPEIVYSGVSPDVITLAQGYVTPYDPNYYDHLSPMCDYVLAGRPGTRYVLFLSPSEDNPGIYEPNGCRSYPMAYVEDAPEGAIRNLYREEYNALQIATGRPPLELPAGGGPPAGAHLDQQPEAAPLRGAQAPVTGGTPWYVVLPLAFAISLATLLIAALLQKRRH